MWINTISSWCAGAPAAGVGISPQPLTFTAQVARRTCSGGHYPSKLPYIRIPPPLHERVRLVFWKPPPLFCVTETAAPWRRPQSLSQRCHPLSTTYWWGWKSIWARGGQMKVFLITICSYVRPKHCEQWCAVGENGDGGWPPLAPLSMQIAPPHVLYIVYNTLLSCNDHEPTVLQSIIRIAS
jgi:hypothetical protein